MERLYLLLNSPEQGCHCLTEASFHTQENEMYQQRRKLRSIETWKLTRWHQNPGISERNRLVREKRSIYGL
jgi:hypothetical protein